MLAQPTLYALGHSFSFTPSSWNFFFFLLYHIEILKAILEASSSLAPQITHHQSVSVLCHHISAVCLSLFIFSANHQDTPWSLSRPLSRPSKLSSCFFSPLPSIRHRLVWMAFYSCRLPGILVPPHTFCTIPLLVQCWEALTLQSAQPHLLPSTSSTWYLAVYVFMTPKYCGLFLPWGLCACGLKNMWS